MYVLQVTTVSIITFLNCPDIKSIFVANEKHPNLKGPSNNFTCWPSFSVSFFQTLVPQNGKIVKRGIVLRLTFAINLQILSPFWMLEFPAAKWGSSTECPFQPLFESIFSFGCCQQNNCTASPKNWSYVSWGLKLDIKKASNLHFHY